MGCATAVSTLHIARGLLEAGEISPHSLHVVDPWQAKLWKNVGRRALERAGLLDGSVEFHEMPAHVALPPP